MIEHAHLWERLAAAHRQLQAVRIEDNPHVTQGSVFVPTVRRAPSRQVEVPGWRTWAAETGKALRN
jgi:hypothetical protein